MAPTPGIEMNANAFVSICRKMLMHCIHILPDGKVSLELTPLRPIQGRVIDRHK